MMAPSSASQVFLARAVRKDAACIFTRLARPSSAFWRTLISCAPRFSASSGVLDLCAASRGRRQAPACGSAATVTPLKFP
jgi:hypothetical protein